MPTDEEILFGDLADTKDKIKALGRLLALRHDEQAQKLQDVTDAVRQVQANQEKSQSGFIMFIGWLRDVVTHAAETLKSKRW